MQWKPLPGTNTDASEMVQTIEELEYGMIQLKNENATESKIMTEIGRVSRGVHLLENKILMFVFSGHGAIGDLIISQDGKHLSLKDDITRPLLAPRNQANPRLTMQPFHTMWRMTQVEEVDGCQQWLANSAVEKISHFMI